ncbi:MAG: amidohydrolase family protein [Verrucomicrobia bacterium]|jgi:cytosine/adenosine deaminase-related metal-dependent hydrolase|nr:amidohydrolase family protein [Verrucomicrobiota bacterium]
MTDTVQHTRPERSLLLRARVALPIASRPIRDAGILISGRRIAAIGRWRAVARGHTGRRIDLGDALVLPGLINAHCHLDYTHMAGLFAPTRHFTDWIKQITVTKQTWSDDEFRDSWLAGADMLLRTGTTTVGDIEVVPGLLPGVWRRTPLRVFSFLEMTGIRSRRDPGAILDEARRQIRVLPRGRCHAWLSPHAPYSTKPELLARSAEVSRQLGWPMTTHVAESASEYEMFARGRGEMYRWLKRNERDMSDCGHGSPVKQLHRSGVLGPHLLAIHVNYLGRGDARLLGESGTHVVHCPHSHTYFQHRAFPYEPLRAAGVNLCLGTDSLASTQPQPGTPAELSLFAEMREFALRHPKVAPATLLRMVTVNAAKALGQAGRLGELSAGAEADLVAVPFDGSARDAARAAVHFDGHVRASLIRGRWAIAPA